MKEFYTPLELTDQLRKKGFTVSKSTILRMCREELIDCKDDRNLGSKVPYYKIPRAEADRVLKNWKIN